MSIAFESQESELQKLRESLCKMSDEELVRFGKAARSLCRHRDCAETFKRQLEEARAEWRRRHPKKKKPQDRPLAWGFRPGRRSTTGRTPPVRVPSLMQMLISQNAECRCPGAIPKVLWSNLTPLSSS